LQITDDTGARVGGPVDASKPLYAAYMDAQAMVSSPEAGHTYNRGVVEIDDAQDCSSCGWALRMVARVTPQEYLDGLGEVPSSWPMESLEAQADAARTYAEYLIAALGQHRSDCNCGVYDDTRNQVYAGWDHEGESQGRRWVQAVEATDAEVVLYRGALIEAQYMSSSGGYTEDVQNVWGGSAVPYLQGVCDPGDYTPANPARAWRVAMSADQVTSRLRPYTGDVGAVTGFGAVHRGVSGRVLSLKVLGTTGSRTVAGTTFRGALGLLDDRVWINHDHSVTGQIRAEYDSLECAPGMPASAQKAFTGGAMQRFDVGTIYRNHAAGLTVWFHGPIEKEYARVKRANGVLGPPLSDVAVLERPAGCGAHTCLRARFANGSIYFSGPTGAHEVHGAVLAHYKAAGSARGHLGFPTSEVVDAGGGGTQSTFAGHGGGAIVVTCPKDGTCSESPANPGS
jgi:SpoIID/LytB domain protein